MQSCIPYVFAGKNAVYGQVNDLMMNEVFPLWTIYAWSL